MPATADAVLVDPDWIAGRLDDPGVRIVEVDVSRAAYDGGHIPGAVLWNAYTDLRRPDYTVAEAGELEGVLSRSGATPATELVFYGYAPHLAYWLMRRHGHRALRILDGPRERWTRSGHSWSPEDPAPPASSYPLADTPSGLVVSTDELLAALDGPDVPAILDVRSQAEFDGERFWPSGATADAGRAGHVPGAVHLPPEALRDAGGAFRDAAGLRALLDDRGVSPDRTMVTYCTIGNRAAQAWFALTHVLGCRDVRVYEGSWAEWGRRADTPVQA